MRPRVGLVVALLVLLSLPRARVARADGGVEDGAGLAVDAVLGTGHVVIGPSMACESTAHEVVPFEAGARGRWQAGPLVVRAGAAITADLALSEEHVTTCLSAGVGGFGDPPADEEIGRGNLRYGLEGLLTVGGSFRHFAFELGALVLTAPLWTAGAGPILPSASLRFGSPEAYGYVGLLDRVPVVTSGGLGRLGMVTGVGERTSLDVGIVWGADLGTFSFAGGLSHRLQGGARVFGDARVGARLLDFTGRDTLDDGLQVALSLGYGWPTI